MIQEDFVNKLLAVAEGDKEIIGVAAGGSWISNEMDAYSDVDLIIVTATAISGDKNKMIGYARKFGNLITAFTGEHVDEPRLLICLYDEPLLHVDLKFITLPELATRVEDPIVLLDRDNQLQHTIAGTKAAWPYPDYQWIEDRFWIWVHYAAQKLGRGEYFETIDFLGYLRATVLAPLMQVKKGLPPRGVRKLEQTLHTEDQLLLRKTVAAYDATAIIHALHHSIQLYQSLRKELFPASVQLQTEAEAKSTAYLQGIVSLKNL